MKIPYKIVPFEIELAKKIQSGEIEGRIVTQDNEPVRIVCFDKKSTNKREMYQVVALVEINGRECLIICGENGLCWDGEDDCNRSLHIELPEETPNHEFKIGDRVRVKLPDKVLQQSMIYGTYQNKILVVKRIINQFTIEVGSCTISPQCFPPEYLEPYEEKHEFKPFDKVLVRDSPAWEWKVDLFSAHHPEKEQGAYVCVGGEFEYCIPYEGNEHLVGTSYKLD